MTDKEMRAYQRLFPEDTWFKETDGTIRSTNPAIAKVTQAEIDAEIVKIDEEDALIKYQKDRRREFPTIAELTVALYDTDDKSAVEAKRAAVKLKYPKP